MNDDLDQLKIPGPIMTALTTPFWEAAAKGQLMIQFCEDCAKAVFYPRTICPICWSHQLIWREASGHGTLKSFSVIYKPGHPGWLPATPYVVGLVELEEGPTMMSFIVTDPEYSCTVGETLKLAPTNIGGRVLPTFKPS